MKSSIESTIAKFKEDLDSFDDNMDKYEYIIDYGDRLVELPKSDRHDGNKVLGCQSELWIKDCGTSLLEFKAFSEAKIVRGLATIVLEIYNNRSKAEILNTDPSVLNKLGISGLLTAGRQNGIGNLIRKIYEIANGK